MDLQILIVLLSAENNTLGVGYWGFHIYSHIKLLHDRALQLSVTFYSICMFLF